MRATWTLAAGAWIAAAAPLSASGLDASQGQVADEGIGIADGRGSFFSVTNRQAGNAIFFVTKLTLQGAMLWNVPFDPGVDATATALTVDGDGNLVVAGVVRDGPRRNLLLVKFTPFGALFWKQFRDAGGNALPTLAAADRDGNIYSAMTVAEPGGNFLKVVRYGPAGAFFWGQPYRGGRSNFARAIVVDANGDAHLTVDTRAAPGAQTITRQVLFTSYGAVVPQ